MCAIPLMRVILYLYHPLDIRAEEIVGDHPLGELLPLLGIGSVNGESVLSVCLSFTFHADEERLGQLCHVSMIKRDKDRGWMEGFR